MLIVTLFYCNRQINRKKHQQGNKIDKENLMKQPTLDQNVIAHTYLNTIFDTDTIPKCSNICNEKAIQFKSMVKKINKNKSM